MNVTENKTSKMAVSAALTALALIFSYIELLMPLPMPVPGIKLGLANVVVVVALYRLGTASAFTINVLRIILSGLLFGNAFAIIYSLAGGVFSFFVMWLLKKSGLFSIVGVSMAGGVAHNLGQLTAAALVVSNTKIFYYFPVLLFAGMLTGIVMGMVAHLICRRLPKL